MTASSHSSPPGLPTRRAARDLLDATLENRRPLEEALETLPKRLDPRDRAAAHRIAAAVLRRLGSLDEILSPFLRKEPPPPARHALRIGAAELLLLDTPPHAAVATAVALAPRAFAGLVNAVLRKVADAAVEFPDDAVEWSYPDWVVDLLRVDLGEEAAASALLAMNEPAEVTVRPDGYTQDRGSQMVAALVGAGPGETVLDLCAAPGGKATALAATGARVVAADLQAQRVGLIRRNVERLGAEGVHPVVADAAHPPLREGVADRVLLDAPCSGLGVLRRRPDARWRLEEQSVERLAALQRRLVDAAVPLVRPGGVLVYSVCTLSRAESIGVDEHVAVTHPDLVPLEVPEAPWRPWGRGAILLPQAAGTDGMFVVRYLVPDATGAGIGD